MSNGKGSKPRPLSVSQDVFANNWDAIFGSKDKSAIPSESKSDNTMQTKPQKKKKSNE